MQWGSLLKFYLNPTQHAVSIQFAFQISLTISKENDFVFDELEKNTTINILVEKWISNFDKQM